MLLADEQEAVRAGLEQVLVQDPDARLFVRTLLGNEVMRRIPVGPILNFELAGIVVNYCIECRWDVAPVPMVTLLNELVTLRGQAELGGILTRVQQRIDPTPDLYQARWIDTDMPFYDRKNLRKTAHELVEKNSRPLLRVSGRSGWGRNYTVRFLNYLSVEKGDSLRVVSESMSPGLGPSYGVEVMAAGLAGQLGTEQLPSRMASHYPAALTRFLLREAMRKQGRTVFLLKGFGSEPDLQPEVKEFIQLLARDISSGEYRKRLRLVLIDYDDVLPNVLAGDVLEEPLPPPRELKDSDVLACLTELNARRQANGKVALDADGFPTVAKNIIASAPTDGKARLQHVYDKLMRLKDA